MELDEILKIAKKASFYSKRIGEEFDRIPILERKDLVQNGPPRSTKMLTGKLKNAYIFSSSGTTASPIYMAYTHKEFRDYATAGVNDFRTFSGPGDMVANLFPPGNLWVGYSIGDIASTTTGCNILPIGANAPFRMAATAMKEFGCNIILGVPSILTAFASYLQKNRIDLHIDSIVYSGEFLNETSKKFLKEIMGVKDFYGVYTCIGGGYIGTRLKNWGDSVYHINKEYCFVEVLDENWEPTDGAGRIVTTNLGRKLMPMIRYDTEDIGRFVDDEHIELIGRAMNRIRVGAIMFSYDVVESAVNELHSGVAVQLQIRAHPQTHMDVLEVLVGSNDEIDESEIEKRVIMRIKEEESSEIEEFLGKSFTIEVKKVRPENMERNERTGKLKRIIDLRETQ